MNLGNLTEHVSESLCSIRGGEFLYWLNDCYILKNYPFACSWWISFPLTRGDKIPHYKVLTSFGICKTEQCQIFRNVMEFLSVVMYGFFFWYNKKHCSQENMPFKLVFCVLCKCDFAEVSIISFFTSVHLVKGSDQMHG